MNNHRRYVYIIRHPKKESLEVYISDTPNDLHILNHIETQAHETNNDMHIVDVYKEYSDHVMKLHETYVFGPR